MYPPSVIKMAVELISVEESRRAAK